MANTGPRVVDDTQVTLKRKHAADSEDQDEEGAIVDVEQKRLKEDERQRQSFGKLKRQINGLVNRVSAENLTDIAVALFRVNVIRGRAILVSCIQSAINESLSYAPVYAALVAVLNSKLPAIGELLAHRLVAQFQQNGQQKSSSSSQQQTTACCMLAHLVDQRVVAESLLVQILEQLLVAGVVSDQSVEVAVSLVKQCALTMQERSPKQMTKIFEWLRRVLSDSHEITKRAQYQIEDLFQARQQQFRGYSHLTEQLDLVEQDDQVTHELSLHDVSDDLELDADKYQFDAEFDEHEEHYNQIRRQILGDSDDEVVENEGEQPDGVADEAQVDDEDDSAPFIPPPTQVQQKQVITDMTESDVITWRRKVYLTIMSSVDFEEAVHKLLKMRLPNDQLLVSMVIECCSQERTYEKYYGLISERLCKLHRRFHALYATEFANIYATIHRYETGRIRNLAKMFAQLFYTGALQWHVLACVQLSETATTSSSRIYLKILMQECQEVMGMKQLCAQLLAGTQWNQGLFPMQQARDCRFAANYWTSIGMAAVTDRLRAHLKSLPAEDEDEDSDDDSSSGSDSE